MKQFVNSSAEIHAVKQANSTGCYGPVATRCFLGTPTQKYVYLVKDSLFFSLAFFKVVTIALRCLRQHASSRAHFFLYSPRLNQNKSDPHFKPCLKLAKCEIFRAKSLFPPQKLFFPKVSRKCFQSALGTTGHQISDIWYIHGCTMTSFLTYCTKCMLRACSELAHEKPTLEASYKICQNSLMLHSGQISLMDCNLHVYHVLRV